MKRFIKICAIAGLILTLGGLGISSLAAVAGAAVGDVRSSIYSRLREGIHWRSNRWNNEFVNRWEEKWDDRWDDRWDDAWENGYWGSDNLNQDLAVQKESAAADQKSPSAEEQDAIAAGNGYQAFSQIRILDVEMDRGSVRLLRGDQTDSIYVKLEDPTGLAQCYSDDGELKVKWESKRKFKNDVKVQIVVPRDYTFEKIELNMGAAYCVAEEIATGKLEMEAGVGSIQYSGQVNGDVEVEAGVGDVKMSLTGSETDFNYKIECGVGSIKVGGSSYSSLGVERRINNQAARSMDLECGVGSVEINFNGA